MKLTQKQLDNLRINMPKGLPGGWEVDNIDGAVVFYRPGEVERETLFELSCGQAGDVFGMHVQMGGGAERLVPVEILEAFVDAVRAARA